MPMSQVPKDSLYRPEFERDSCGFGLIAQMDDEASHDLVQTAIRALERMTHRGAIAADGKTGDGCGLLLKIPAGYFRAVAERDGIELGENNALAMVFLSQDEARAQAGRAALEKHLTEQGFRPRGWRQVPVDPEVLGEQARISIPRIEQLFIDLLGSDPRHSDAPLLLARRKAERAMADDPDFYVCSLSSSVVSYKGLMMPEWLPHFYADLNDPELTSSICVFHQRFSTNTLPQWALAQPFRYLAHNGEINTIRGNRNWAEARAHTFSSANLPGLEQLRPLVSAEGSDSCALDNMLEILHAGGIDIFRAMRLLIPPAWQNAKEMDSDLRAFYEYSSMHMEPWDGPAGIVLTDGRYAACILDRNGLRPARYVITRDRRIMLASEIGVHEFADADVVEKGRLRPGEMLAADTQTGELLTSQKIDRINSTRNPYWQWLHEGSRHTRSLVNHRVPEWEAFSREDLRHHEKIFDVSYEEREQVLRVLADVGQEAVGSMGDDTPLPVMSGRVRSLYDYFRQQFAQVTNPAIDSLREKVVMSLETCFGPELNLFDETLSHAVRLVSESPVLPHKKYEHLKAIDDPDYQPLYIDLNYDEHRDLEEVVREIAAQAVQGVKDGNVLIILSDRDITPGKIPVHALLATGAVHHALIHEGLRCQANIIVDTGTARDPHHFAVLIGYGATAVHPYLALQSLSDMVRQGEIDKETFSVVERNYCRGIDKGLLKICSKMGISAITSYRGAQLFEVVGLGDEVVDLCFVGSVSRIEGTGFEELAADQRLLAAHAWSRQDLRQGGLLKYVHDEEYHAFNPDIVQALQASARSGAMEDYRAFRDLVNSREPMVLRDLLRLREDVESIPLEEVEPVEAITPRFDSAGMSLGALSPDAHETLAEAMNRLGARSNSGEGGEDPARYGTDRTSKIKQVASGRFGVTPEYLVNAEVLQIKIAQGAKPGEGGQLPGRKVNELIARLRYCNPGVTLISPPPHHDIYSIEDLAQLIFDLKQVNPQALVSVKLVASAGVGTIAAGVAKAYADLITISGYDGGTGASPLTSIKYAGGPWEMGISEAQVALRGNNLRDKIRLQADGGMKTGLDVVKAAILGAESFGFGTAPMIAMGCKYLRICHLNNCATGVATQNKILRRDHFIGEADMVVNYFTLVAEETREWMAAMGVRRLVDLIGRTDLLEISPGVTDRQHGLNLEPLLSDGGIPADVPRYCQTESNPSFDKGELAERMVRDTREAIENMTGGEFHYEINNTNRSIGARVSGEIARRHGDHGMRSAPLVIRLTGTAGQSFGVWNADGLHLHLQGDANDYVGKGMAGGKLVLHPGPDLSLPTHKTPIMGNTCLYGATGGKLFAAGTAGERFAIRNSGAMAVIEGVGDHGCEYMTGGAVIILGSTGVNFGAGMAGGFALVLDEQQDFPERCNEEMIEWHPLTSEGCEDYVQYLRGVLMEYSGETGSTRAQQILEQLEDWLPRFWLVAPKEARIETLLDGFREAA